MLKKEQDRRNKVQKALLLATHQKYQELADRDFIELSRKRTGKIFLYSSLLVTAIVFLLIII